MRDGTLLATDKYSPDSGGKLPVILARNPYAGVLLPGGCFMGLGASLAVFAQNGYHALAQECRGTARSQGRFNAMAQEAQDGYDAIEWAGTQDWSTGKVGTTSGSYLGLTQWQPAIHSPPHLAAIAPAVTGSDYHDNWTYVNGIFDTWLNMSWPSLAFVPDQIKRFGKSNQMPPDQADKIAAQFVANMTANLLPNWVWTLPLTSFDQFTVMAPYYYDWTAHPFYDAFWARMDVETHYDDVKVPALISDAWYDLFSVGALRNFDGMRSRGGTPQVREGTKLYMGAYGHAPDTGTPTFGSDAALLPIDTQLAFYDRYLKDENNGWESTPNVKLYVLVPPDSGNEGSGFYITGDSYPLPGSQQMNLFLASGGHANTSKGDGELVFAPTRRSTPDHFDYDPANPVPTNGGNMCCNNIVPNGAQEQSQIEMRDDVLVYSTAPLTADMAAIGPVEVKLWARTSARDTDFTAKLVDVHPDGLTHNVLDRIVRASLRRGSKLPPEAIEPGQAYEYTIPVGNAGTIFKKGHVIRLEISSSSFPHYLRNLNTGKNSLWTSEMVVAHQTILHNHQHPSRLILVVAPGVHAP
jgi:putative CocE/NonD family hydrolase